MSTRDPRPAEAQRIPSVALTCICGATSELGHRPMCTGSIPYAAPEAKPRPADAQPGDVAIRTLEYEAGVREQEVSDLKSRVVQLESAAGFVVRRASLAATGGRLRERIEALRVVLDTNHHGAHAIPVVGCPHIPVCVGHQLECVAATTLDDKLDAQRECAIEAAALIVDKEASIRRMRAQAFDDDSDRADGSAQVDDIEREEQEAELLEYAATRVRSLKQRRERAPVEEAPSCAYCSHPMVRWVGAQWQCAMTSCRDYGVVVTRPETEGPAVVAVPETLFTRVTPKEGT